MITYGFSIQGKSHKSRGVVCQDASEALLLNGDWYLGVVADGVGSAANADIGSKTAVNSLYEYCKKNISSNMSVFELKEMLEDGYEYAFGQIELCARETGNSIESYDTTLSSVLYDGEKVIYGHAGDGGILVRLYNGIIKPITQRQKGVDGSSVIPLRGGNRTWEFGIFEEKTAAVLLATDGMLDGVLQPVLLNLPKDKITLARGNFPKNNAYITASEFFMNPYSVYLNENIRDKDSFIEKFVEGSFGDLAENEFMNCMKNAYVKMFGLQKAEVICKEIEEYVYAAKTIENVTDDKSIVCIINEKVNVTPQDICYYREVDWQWKQSCYQAFLYGKPLPDEPVRKSIEELVNGISKKEISIKSDKADDNLPKPDDRKFRQETEKYRIMTVISLAVSVVSLIMFLVTLHIYNGSQSMLKNYKNREKQIESSIEKPSPTPYKEKGDDSEINKYKIIANNFDKLQQEIAGDIIHDVKNIDISKKNEYRQAVKNADIDFSEYFENIWNESNSTKILSVTDKSDTTTVNDDSEPVKIDTFKGDLMILQYFDGDNLESLKEKIKAEYDRMEYKEQHRIQENLDMLLSEEDN